MPVIVRPSTPADATPIAALMAQAFNVPLATGREAMALMSWKFWDPRADWPGPRSFVAELDGRIVAHVGIWPVTFSREGATIRGVHMLDWAATPDAQGGGMSLVRKLITEFDFVYGIGGSDITRELLPALGFKEISSTWSAARPIRPVRQLLTHQVRNWKLAARFVRNAWWSMSPPVAIASGWDAAPLRAEDVPAPLTAASIGEARAMPRAGAFFEYVMRCPIGAYRLFGLSNRDGLQGCFLLGTVRGQARIGGIWLRDPSDEHWRIAYGLACRMALKTTGASEVAAAVSKGVSHDAAARAGLRVIGRNPTPVVLISRRNAVSLHPDFQFQMADDDSLFMDLGQTYLT